MTQDIKTVLIQDYLMTEASTPLGIKGTQFAVRTIGEEVVVFCATQAEEVVKMVLAPYGVKVVAFASAEKPQKRGSERPPRGMGFGMGWRTNAAHKGVEVSFTEKPDDAMRELLKKNKFRWSHASGVWYTKDTAEARAFCKANFEQVEGV